MYGNITSYPINMYSFYMPIKIIVEEMSRKILNWTNNKDCRNMHQFLCLLALTEFCCSFPCPAYIKMCNKKIGIVFEVTRNSGGCQY